MKRFFGIALAALIILMTACTAQELTIKDVWARPGNQGANSAIYFVINNPTDQDDVLLAASSDVASVLELHMSKMMEDGTMMMEKQEEVSIPASNQVDFKPGGLHVMLIDLQKDLQAGDQFNLKLQFKNQGDVLVEVTVQEP